LEAFETGKKELGNRILTKSRGRLYHLFEENFSLIRFLEQGLFYIMNFQANWNRWPLYKRSFISLINSIQGFLERLKLPTIPPNQGLGKG
jgi:hypothetical protein